MVYKTDTFAILSCPLTKNLDALTRSWINGGSVSLSSHLRVCSMEASHKAGPTAAKKN